MHGHETGYRRGGSVCARDSTEPEYGRFPTKPDIKGVSRSLVIRSIPRKPSHRDRKVKSVPRDWGPEACMSSGYD